MRKAVIGGIIAILLLVSMLSVAAQEENEEFLGLFSFTPVQSIDPCEVGEYVFEFQNFGPFLDTYDLEFSPFDDFVSYSENPVTLAPNTVKNVSVLVRPTCELFGDQEIKFKVTNRATLSSFEELVELRISARDIPLIADGIEIVRVAYENSVVNLPIRNLGDRSTTYALSIEGEDWMRIEPSSVTIPAGSSTTFKLFTNPDEELVAQEDFEAVIVATVADTGLEYATTVVVSTAPPGIVEQLYTTYLVYSIAVIVLIVLILVFLMYLRATAEARLLKREEKRKERELKKAEKERAKEEKIRLKEEAKLEKQQLKEEKIAARLAAKEEKRQARFDAKYEKKKSSFYSVLYNVLKGEYLLLDKITVKPLKRKKVITLIVLLVLATLVTLSIVYWWVIAPYVMPYIWYIAGGVIGLLAIGILIAVIKRQGRSHLEKTVEGKDQETLRKEALTALQEEYVVVEREAYKTFWPAAGLGKPFVMFVFFAGLAVLSWVLREYLAGYWQYVALALGSLAGLFLIIVLGKFGKSRKIFRTFRFDMLYTHTELSTKWRRGLGGIVLKLKKAADGVIMGIQRFKASPVFLIPDEPVYQYFEVKALHFEEQALDKAVFRFRIKKRWLEKNHIPNDKVRLARYTHNKWTNIGDTEFISDDKKYAYFQASHNGLGYFAVLGKPVEPKEEKKKEKVVIKREVVTESVSPKSEKRVYKKKKLIKDKEKDYKPLFKKIGITVLVILALLAIILGAVSLNQYQQREVAGTAFETSVESVADEVANVESSEAGIPTQRWTMNTEHRIDLNEFFEDPDGDSLTFENTPVTNIDIRYEGSLAVLTPRPDWSGQESVVFIASDSAGSSVSSNDVVLIVEGLSVGQFVSSLVKEYITYIIFGVGLIVLLIFSFEIWKRMKKDNDDLPPEEQF